MWFMLASPFITSVFSFMIVNGTLNINDPNPDARQGLVIIYGFLFSLWMLIGFATCAGIFIISLV